MALISGIPELSDLSSINQEDHACIYDKSLNQLKDELRQLRKRRQEVMNGIPEIMVMEEQGHKRTMHVYERGDYMQPRQEVQAGVPAILPTFPESFPIDRLGFSQWLFSPENPLTARVSVNRYWQMIFGKGLVTTPGDFGLQGALPSHPELLDWLAVDFMNNGWDVKRLLRQLVSSEVYQRASIVVSVSLEIDPDNVLLARGSSYRLPAEMIRDNALAASGLLVRNPGGSSVRPYQPEGLWIEKSFFSQILLTYQQDQGEDLYRRSMYTFIRRTAPPPAMAVFDQPNREVCTLKRETTNTPLQALVLLNDPQFVEAARVLAERIQLEGGADLTDQISMAFRLSTSRLPEPEEVQILEKLYHEQLSLLEQSNGHGREILNVGESSVDNSLDKKKTAALAMVTNTILNHDESYMKR